MNESEQLRQANDLARQCVKCDERPKIFYEPGCMVAECGCSAVTLPEWNAKIYTIWNARYGKDLK